MFAALSYAVTRSGRGSGTNLNKEQAALHAARMMTYAATLQQAVQRLMLTGRCRVGDLNFSSPHFYEHGHGAYENAAAPDDHSCDIFHPAGGNVTWQPIPLGIAAFPDQGHIQEPEYMAKPEYGIAVIDIAGLGVGALTPDNYQQERADIVLVAAISRDACRLVNAQAGLSGDIPHTANQFHPPFDTQHAFAGSIPATNGGIWRHPSTIGYHEEDSVLAGKTTGCIMYHNPNYSQKPDEPAGGWSYMFYHALLVR